MKKTFIIFTILTLTGVVACENKHKCECSSENVCVTLINSTGQIIETVKLIHEKGNIATGQLAIDNETCILFKSPGENSFSLTAILNNGDSLISTAGYCEGGYRFIATATKDTIKIELNNEHY